MSSEYFIKQIKKRYLIETKDSTLHVEWSFVSVNQWKKKNKHFIHLYTDDKKFKVQVLDNTVTSRKHVHSYRIWWMSSICLNPITIPAFPSISEQELDSSFKTSTTRPRLVNGKLVPFSRWWLRKQDRYPMFYTCK